MLFGAGKADVVYHDCAGRLDSALYTLCDVSSLHTGCTRTMTPGPPSSSRWQRMCLPLLGGTPSLTSLWSWRRLLAAMTTLCPESCTLMWTSIQVCLHLWPLSLANIVCNVICNVMAVQGYYDLLQAESKFMCLTCLQVLTAFAKPL